MFCSLCGNRLPEEGEFCSNCGTRRVHDMTRETSDSHAQPKNGVQTPAAKSKLVAGLLGIFLGLYGAQDFYLGYTARAIGLLIGCLLNGILFWACLLVGLVFWPLLCLSFWCVVLKFGVWCGILTRSIQIFCGVINVDAKGNPLV